jgi:hypothetical protein
VTISDLLPDLLGRIEENLPSSTPPGPTFWSLTGEVYPQMVYAMFEAALITGTVQLNSQLVTLVSDTTYFSIQGILGSASVAPQGVIAAIRLSAPGPIKKTTLSGLDDMYPTWQQETPGPDIKAWFPLGVSMIGIYPQLNADTQVVIDFIQSPVNEYRPYTGNENVPFQREFNDLITKYAAVLLRTKEGGQDAEEADTTFRDYMETLKDLSLFQARIDSLVFSFAYGSKTLVNPRTQG